MKMIMRFFILALCATSSLIIPIAPMTESHAKSSDELISLSYNQEELSNVINYIATKRGVNILFPTKSEDKVTGTLSWHLNEKVTVDKAWNILQTILSIAGYSIVPYPTYYEIIKNNQNSSREPFPLYIGV